MASAARRSEGLSSQEKAIIATLREKGSATSQQVADAQEVSKQTAWRHLTAMLEKGVVEYDTSGGKAFLREKWYRATVILNDGVDFYITPADGGEPIRMSWNSLLIQLANQTQPPRIMRQAGTLAATVMELTAYAIAAAQDSERAQGVPAVVSESDLMEPRGKLRQYWETLVAEEKIVAQILMDDRLWSPDSLWLNIFRKTDKPLTFAEAEAAARKIRDRYFAEPEIETVEGEFE
jgi:DNA-binding CsgD family transcriptional regulator